jgi:hypothetical protein
MGSKWTCNVAGNVVQRAKDAGYHAYYASGVTAIEIGPCSKSAAHRIASQFGTVLYIFE